MNNSRGCHCVFAATLVEGTEWLSLRGCIWSSGLVNARDGAIEGLELLRGHLLADLEEDVDVLLLEVVAGVGDAVDGGEDPGLVTQVGARDGGEVGLFTLEIGVEGGEGGAVGLEDVVHAVLLVGGEVELADGLVVVPPAAAEAEAKTHARLGT